ncbi:MAG: serine/threonine protein kinase, partial [Planctomycetes bacterium]|nr:serine/threonine protein kinase [Planctomycetota bacterium]
MIDRIGKYRVLREIGRGGMGTVYLGHDAFSDRPVAIKIANRDGRGAPESEALFRSMFFNETRAAGLLRHPNIVRLIDAGNEGEHWYIVMEYVPAAMTLDAWALRGGAPKPADVAEIALKCAEALEYGHRKGVIHRDIKPGNVLVADDGTVKVTDFSIAVLTDAATADTQLMVRAGSPLYMSPEQVREENLTGQS